MAQGDLFEGGAVAGSIVGGKYKLIKKLSEGGGGIVWEALDPGDKAIALKFLKWSPLKSRKIAAERFKNEFAILKSLSHPNIAEIYDFGIDHFSGSYFFTTELLTVGDLKSMIGEPVASIEEVLLQALRSLEYLRGNKLLHLDIKPQNFLLRHDGSKPELVLIDFGLATFTPPDRPGGTASYMPPEQIARRLEIHDLILEYPAPDHRSDLYSLGVTFYYCLTGVQPFCVIGAEGNHIDAAATMEKHLKYDPPCPSTYRPEIPAYMDRIIMKLIARHPDDRYSSAIVAAQALQYSSPSKHAPESTQTLLAYLPKEGRLIGRQAESSIIEQSLKDVSSGIHHVAPIICIAGGRGTGRSRLLMAAKPMAQQLEISVVLVDENTTPLSEILNAKTTSVILIDDIEQYLQGNNLRHENLMAELHTLIRKLRLQQRIQNSPGPRLFLTFTLNTDQCGIQRALMDLNLDETICHTITLKNFNSSQVSEYLAAALGEVPDASVVDELKRCTDGNPLFITEHLEEMIARGKLFSLAGRPDSKTLKTIGVSFSHNPPSRSFADMVEKKLDLLPEEAKTLALVMACWQRPTSVDELKETSANKTVGHELLLLVSSGLVKKNAKDGRFVFINSQTSEVICNKAEPRLKILCHDAIATFLKRQKHKKLDEIDFHIGYGSKRLEKNQALKRLAAHATQKHEPLEAAKHLEELLKFLPAENIPERADTLSQLGSAYEKARCHEDAKHAYRRLGLLKAPPDLRTQFKIRSAEQLGLLALRQRHLNRARQFFTEASNLLKNSPAMLAWRLRLENFLGGVDLRDGKIEEALARFERTSIVAEKALPKSKRSLITNNELGEALLRTGKVRRALTILKHELESAEELKDHERMAGRNYLLGDALRHDSIHNYKEALSHYQTALKIARSHHMVELQIRIHNGLGNLNLKMSHPERALEHYREGLKIAQQVEGETTSVELMIGMGLAAQQMSKPDSTIEYFEAALDFSQGPKGTYAGLIRRYRPAIYVSLGDAYYQKHDFDHAENYLKEALALDKKHELTPDIRYSLYGTYVEIFLARGEINQAKRYLPTLQAIAKAFPPASKHLKELKGRINVIQFCGST